MRVALTSFGTAGDNEPFLALGRALRDAGHDPVLLLNPRYEAAAARLGLAFRPVGDHWDIDQLTDQRKYLHPRTGGIAIWKELCIPNMPASHRAMTEVIAEHRPDVAVCHFLCSGAQWAARQAGVPVALATLAPCWWYSRADPAVFTPQVPPRWLHPHVMWIARAMTNRYIGGAMRDVCAELGVEHTRDLYFRAFADADANLALWSPAFRAPAADDPPNAALVGFPPGTPGALDPDLQAFLDAGAPPVVVGLGTSARATGAGLYRAAAEACRALGRRAVLVGAPADAALDDTTLVVPFAPYATLFPRASIVVHHGGIGTTAEAMRARRPAVIVPFANDQFDNALRAQRLGAARVLLPKRATPTRLANALAAVANTTPPDIGEGFDVEALVSALEQASAPAKPD